MKIVIDIPEEIYKNIQSKSIEIQAEGYTIENAILNGTPLPKGYEKLIILSENKLKENLINSDFSCQKWISEVDLSNATVTIIEADKELEDKNDD